MRFQGDPVVCIVATDRYLAEDAAEAIEIDYDVLPAVLNYADAVRDGAPLVDDSLHQQSGFASELREGRRRGAHARRRTRSWKRRSRSIGRPICRSRPAAASPSGTRGREHLTFHVGNQVPHPLRTQLAARLRLSESQVTVIVPPMSEAASARRSRSTARNSRSRRSPGSLRRPVRWREDRMENLQAASHAREQTCRVRAGVDRDGRILALDFAIEEDFGAYCFYPPIIWRVWSP